MALALCLLGSATLLWLWLSLRRGSLLAPGWWRAR